MKKIQNLAIITARGGSKRIPRKNIKNFMGMPMISYAINAAISSNIFDEIMVSTDDEEIAKISLQLGAKVPFMRSHKNADDFATTADVLAEVLQKYKEFETDITNICCIYPCVPFLNGEILKQAYDVFISSNADALTPVTKFSFPIQRAFRIDENNYLRYREIQNANKRSQDLEPMYHDVGMFYFYKVDSADYVHRIPFIIDQKLVQDIDTIDDWEMAELKYKVLNEK